MHRTTNLTRVGNREEQDLIYYNGDIIDGKELDEGVNSNPSASFNETRDTAIIKDCSKYEFSIIRFQMVGSGITLPLFIPIVQPDQDDRNLTIYKIGLRVKVNYDFGGIDKTETFNIMFPIEFRSQSTTAPLPQPPLGRPQDFSSDYYYVQDYTHWVGLINDTYQKLWDNINFQFKQWWAVSGGVGTPPDLETAVPKMMYNPDTKRFNLFTDKNGWGNTFASKDSDTSEQWQMFFNSNMYGLFDSFPHEYEGGDLASQNETGIDGFAFEILVIDKLGTNLYTDTSTAPASAPDPQVPPYITYVITDQNWSSTDTLWSPIGSIVFVSSLLPIMSESTGQPIQFGTGNNQVSGSSNGSAFQPIITDITLGESAEAYKGKITYVPSGQYRFSSLSKSPAAIRDIDIQVFWKNRLDGNLIPLRMFNKSSISIKMLFKKKAGF